MQLRHFRFPHTDNYFLNDYRRQGRGRGATKAKHLRRLLDETNSSYRVLLHLLLAFECV